MPRLDRAELDEGLRLLGVDLRPVMQATSPQVATERLEQMQQGARKALKRLALTHHPDRTGGDEEKAKQFVRASNALDWLKDAKIRVRPPPVRRYVSVNWWNSATTNTATTNTTTTGFHYTSTWRRV